MTTKEELRDRLLEDDKPQFIVKEKVDWKSRFKSWWSGATAAEDGSIIWAVKRAAYWVRVGVESATEFFKAKAEDRRLKLKREAGVDDEER